MTQRRPFPPGSSVVLYSDGITEAENVAGEEFENARLEADPRASTSTQRRPRCATGSPSAVDAFTAGAPQKDDQTLVIARSLLSRS